MSQVAGWVTHRYVKYVVIAFWLVVVGVLAPLGGKLTGVEKNDAKSWLPASAESTQALDKAGAFVDQNTIPAVVLYHRDGGLTAQDRSAIADEVTKFQALGAVQDKVTGPIPSKDGEAVQVIVPLNLGSNGWDKAAASVDQIKAITDTSSGLNVYVTGPAGQAADSSKAFSGIESTLLYAAIAVVVVILLLTYRSPILWLLPVLSAGVALMVSQGVVYLLASNTGLTVNAQSAGILTVLVFGAGTDYALLLVARYREELRRHGDRHEAMAVALHRAGPAIIASGSTVAISMLALLFATVASTSGLGPVAAVGIVVALAVMLTLLPALLVVCGRWVFWPRVPHLGQSEPTTHGFWAKVGGQIERRPRGTWVVTAAALLIASLGVIQLNATGLSNAESFRGNMPSITGEQVLEQHFPGGAGAPVTVVANAAAADAVVAAFKGVDGIDPATVTQPAVKDGVVYVEGTLTGAPDSSAARDTIDRARVALHAVPGADALVGGSTALNLDVERAAARDDRVIIPIILLVVFLILTLLLRAIVAPLILVGTVILSFGAAIGVSALVFRHLFGFAGADTSFPLFVFVFLVALGIDYNIFLMTRVREEAQRIGHHRGSLVGLAATGGVITSAGLVLAGTFAVLGTLPIVSFAEIGFAVAFGVLLDTIIVRSVLVTALNLDVGSRMWWPSALARRSADAPTLPPEPEQEDRVPVGV